MACAQLGDAGHGRVLREPLADRLDGGLLDGFGRVEVGLARPEGDDVVPVRRQLLGASR